MTGMGNVLLGKGPVSPSPDILSFQRVSRRYDDGRTETVEGANHFLTAADARDSMIKRRREMKRPVRRNGLTLTMRATPDETKQIGLVETVIEYWDDEPTP